MDNPKGGETTGFVAEELLRRSPLHKPSGRKIPVKVTHRLQMSKKKTSSISVGLYCSQRSISSYFHSGVECTDHGIARELNADAKLET